MRFLLEVRFTEPTVITFIYLIFNYLFYSVLFVYHVCYLYFVMTLGQRSGDILEERHFSFPGILQQ